MVSRFNDELELQGTQPGRVWLRTKSMQSRDVDDFLHLIYIAESCFLELLFSMFSIPAFPFS